MVPKKFKLGHRTWKVRRVTTTQMQAFIDKHDLDDRGQENPPALELNGMCSSRTETILINVDTHTDERQIEHTFWHEFMHAVLFAEGYTAHNEEQVERFASNMTQFWDSVKWEAE